MEIRTVYLAGKISGQPRYRSKFRRAAAGLRRRGYKVMSPAVLPAGWKWVEYMQITLMMLHVCDAVAMLPGWQDSRGARIEHEQAQIERKPILYIDEDGQGGFAE